MDKKVFTVYMHIAPNMKKYIGMTCKSVKQRWVNGNGYSLQPYFYRAINKYGWNSFQHIIIADKLTKKEACKLEIDMIKYWNTTDRDEGYNILTGGGTGRYGIKHTQETIEKIRKSNLGKSVSEETKEKLRQVNLGRKFTNEQKKKISNSISGVKNGFYGKRHTQETIEKIKETLKGQLDGDKNPFYGKHHTDETKLLISKKKSTPVSQYSKDGIFIKDWAGASEVKKTLGIDNSTIGMCCKGNAKTAGGFIWKYSDFIPE